MTGQAYWAVATLVNVQQCNDYAESKGWGLNNLHIQLSASGVAPHTHFGGHIGYLSQPTAELIEAELGTKILLFPATESPYAALEAKGVKIIPSPRGIYDA